MNSDKRRRDAPGRQQKAENVLKIEIKNGRVIDPANNLDARQSLFIAGQLVAALGQAPDGFKPDRVIDAAGKIVQALLERFA